MGWLPRQSNCSDNTLCHPAIVYCDDLLSYHKDNKENIYFITSPYLEKAIPFTIDETYLLLQL